MIDFHTHIIPNIDDGARNIEETFKLIKEAKEAGFEGIILTSHYRENYFETNIPERLIFRKRNIYDRKYYGLINTRKSINNQ